MTRPVPVPNGSLRVVSSVAIVAVGVAINSGLDSPYRLFPALLLIAAGVAGVANAARSHGVDRLRLTTHRWWAAAFAAFLPYALVTAPGSESAAAVGDAVAGPGVPLALEAIAGATVCCAVALTVLYGLASYGIHPGRPSPEERVLGAERDE